MPLTAGGEKVRMETEEWYIRFKDANGKWQREKGYTDKAATEKLMVEIQQRVDRKASGVADPFEEHHRRPLSEHLEEFEQGLAAKENTPEHVDWVIRKVRKIIEDCGFTLISDIQASRVKVHLKELREDGLGPTTANHYLGSVKHFTRWLVGDRRTGDDRLAHLSMLNTETDRRHDRRAREPSQFSQLIESATTGPPIETIPGADRAMMYVLSAWTGFRRKELASLTLRSFDLDAQTPSVRVDAAYTKNSRLPRSRCTRPLWRV